MWIFSMYLYLLWIHCIFMSALIRRQVWIKLHNTIIKMSSSAAVTREFPHCGKYKVYIIIITIGFFLMYKCCVFFSLPGTSHNGGYSHDAVMYALTECGICHIDTAKRYGCEAELGKAVRESGLPRSDLWLTNKLWPGDYGYTAAKKACLDSCLEMGVEYFGMPSDW